MGLRSEHEFICVSHVCRLVLILHTTVKCTHCFSYSPCPEIRRGILHSRLNVSVREALDIKVRWIYGFKGCCAGEIITRCVMISTQAYGSGETIHALILAVQSFQTQQGQARNSH